LDPKDWSREINLNENGEGIVEIPQEL